MVDHGPENIGRTLVFDDSIIGKPKSETRVVSWTPGRWLGVDCGGGFYNTIDDDGTRGIVMLSDFELKGVGFGIVHRRAYWKTPTSPLDR